MDFLKTRRTPSRLTHSDGEIRRLTRKVKRGTKNPTGRAVRCRARRGEDDRQPRGDGGFATPHCGHRFVPVFRRPDAGPISPEHVALKKSQCICLGHRFSCSDIARGDRFTVVMKTGSIKTGSNLRTAARCWRGRVRQIAEKGLSGGALRLTDAETAGYYHPWTVWPIGARAFLGAPPSIHPRQLGVQSASDAPLLNRIRGHMATDYRLSGWARPCTRRRWRESALRGGAAAMAMPCCWPIAIVCRTLYMVHCRGLPKQHPASGTRVQEGRGHRLRAG